jgi:hypothetical protein
MAETTSSTSLDRFLPRDLISSCMAMDSPSIYRVPSEACTRSFPTHSTFATPPTPSPTSLLLPPSTLATHLSINNVPAAAAVALVDELGCSLLQLNLSSSSSSHTASCLGSSSPFGGFNDALFMCSPSTPFTSPSSYLRDRSISSTSSCWNDASLIADSQSEGEECWLVPGTLTHYIIYYEI